MASVGSNRNASTGDNNAQSSKALIQQLLIAEEKAEVVLKQARENKVKMLSEAKVSAKHEVAQFRQLEESRYNEEVKKTSGLDLTEMEQLEQQADKEIGTFSNSSKSHLNTLSKIIIDEVLNVDLTLSKTTTRTLHEDSHR